MSLLELYNDDPIVLLPEYFAIFMLLVPEGEHPKLFKALSYQSTTIERVNKDLKSAENKWKFLNGAKVFWDSSYGSIVYFLKVSKKVTRK